MSTEAPTVRFTRRTTRVGLALLACIALLGVFATSAFAAPTPLVGTFTVTPGAQPGATVTGSYFRMIQAGGAVGTGPYLPNGNSTATDKTYTLLSPGTDGGLVTGSFQPAPATPFSGGNALANRIIQPTGFFGVNFSASTQSPDPQTTTAVTAPTITNNAGVLSGDLRAFGAWWNNQTFNQGSPKPNGTNPGLTAGPTGTFNSGTGAYTLDWTSLIVGGPFDGFTGQWHLTGTFYPSTTFRIATPSPLPAATRGVPYSVQLTTQGTAAVVKFKRTGNLPKGLKLANTGLISGTPKLKNVLPGTYQFTVTAKTKKTKTVPSQTTTSAFTLVLK